jgi:hypothetical protein
MFGMLGFLMRAALFILAIWLIVKLIQAIKPKARHFTTPLEYPNREQIALVEEGDMVLLDAEPQMQRIYAYRTLGSGDDMYLGEVPVKYFRSIEPVLRRGKAYQAVVTKRTTDNIYVEFSVSKKELPEEFV